MPTCESIPLKVIFLQNFKRYIPEALSEASKTFYFSIKDYIMTEITDCVKISEIL